MRVKRVVVIEPAGGCSGAGRVAYAPPGVEVAFAARPEAVGAAVAEARSLAETIVDEYSASDLLCEAWDLLEGDERAASLRAEIDGVFEPTTVWLAGCVPAGDEGWPGGAHDVLG
jgi:hypothetical protein